MSPWIAEGQVFNDEYRHTSLIATLRQQRDLGEPFTARDATARSFSEVFTLDTPRDPTTWPVPTARPVPEFTHDDAALGTIVSAIGTGFLATMRQYAAQHDLDINGLPKDPNADLPPEQIIEVMHGFLATFFPLLSPTPPTAADKH